MPHWKCLSNIQFCAFKRKNLTSASLSLPPWNSSCWPDNKLTLEALTVCVRVEGNQVTSHSPLSGIMNTSRGSMSTSKSLLPRHPKGKERPISLSACRAFQCGKCARRRWDREEGEVIHAGLAWRMGSNNRKPCPLLREKCVSADSGASGLELIAKHKDGINSHWIDDHITGYVSTRPHMAHGCSVGVEAPTYLGLSESNSLSKTPGLKSEANNVRGTKGEERIRRCLGN